MPGSPGLSVISAHRDTHFSFLRDLASGDSIRVDSARGASAYRIVSTRIVDAATERIATREDIDALVLVTCYPFDALAAGGSLRYVVTALRDPA